MGVFLFSNTTVNTSKVEEVFKTRGHINVDQHVHKSGHIVVHAPKVIVKNTNFLNGDDLCSNCDDFAVGVGTFFYKGTYGAEALKLVYHNIEDVLKNNPVYGHWAFCIRKGTHTYIFNDMSGFCRLYCYENDGMITISTSMLGVLANIDEPKFDKMKLSNFLTNSYARESSFIKGLEMVNPLNYLVLEDNNGYKWIAREVPQPKRVEDFNEAVAYVKSLFKQQMDNLQPALKNVKVYADATGGLDSRLVSAVLKNSDVDFDYINYPLFGPDSEIANILATGIKRELHTQTNISCGSDYANHFGEFDFGHNFSRQYPNSRWILKHDFEFSGARGECLDLPDIYTDEDLSYANDPKISILVDKLLTNRMMPKDVREKVAKYFNRIISERIGINENIIMSEQQQAAFCQLIAGQWSDSMYCSGSQAICYFYQIYNEWHFSHFVTNLAFYKVKGDRRLSLKLIKEMDSELASFPFVSRRRTSGKSISETESLPTKYKSYNGIKKILPDMIVDVLYKLLKRTSLKNDYSESIDYSLYKDVVNVNKLIKYPNLYYDINNRLISVDYIRKIMNVSF